MLNPCSLSDFLPVYGEKNSVVEQEEEEEQLEQEEEEEQLEQEKEQEKE